MEGVLGSLVLVCQYPNFLIVILSCTASSFYYYNTSGSTSSVWLEKMRQINNFSVFYLIPEPIPSSLFELETACMHAFTILETLDKSMTMNFDHILDDIALSMRSIIGVVFQITPFKFLQNPQVDQWNNDDLIHNFIEKKHCPSLKSGHLIHLKRCKVFSVQ